MKTYIGIIVALKNELNNFISKCDEKVINNETFYIYNDEIIISFCGVGKTNAARATTSLISNFSIRLIVNIGSACSANNYLDIYNLHLANNCQYGDVDVSCDMNYQINQIPYESKKFLCSTKFNNLIYDKLQILARPIFSGCAITVDSFVTKNNISKFFEINLNDVYSIDMESAAIGQVCNYYKVPFNILKIISDKIYLDSDNEIDNHDQYTNSLAIISLMNSQIIDLIFELAINKLV
ncbi:MAG: 5'-methylthioadenosine/S-adenosylhomocysteine nucleosidase [Ureaplasma sp.]|nr:5'-methylthioadenosine/S-adenosylhomocysteine nucleosidase [Ureaplasma sp.]MDE7221894.1 5'-methylthioadenosine/S-adenosylhomocysteine nucleosidase [Ureaplasma sp.]